MGVSVCVLILAMVAAYSYGSEVVLTRPGGAFHMGHRVPLPCVYTGSDWLMMRWMRDQVVLAYVVKGKDIPQWTDQAPNSFQDHVELFFENKENTRFYLNMTVEGLECGDTGVYRCEVTTLTASQAVFNTTKVEILVDPVTPTIMDDFFLAKENVTFELSCSGRVGLPPATIKWFVKFAGNGDFRPLDPALTSQTNTKGEGENCWYSGNARVTVTMDESLDGAKYACGVDDVIDDQNEKFDEVVLELQGKTTTPAPTTTTTTKKPKIGQNINGSGVNSLSLLAAWTCVFISVLNVFTQRPS